jgi:hypothetical protein
MRSVARYCFEAPITDSTLRDPLQEYLRTIDLVGAWLRGKGVRERVDGVKTILYPDGRRALLEDVEIDIGQAGLQSYELMEPIPSGRLTTRLEVAFAETGVAVGCELRVGSDGNPVSPVLFDVSCPRVLREILTTEVPWLYGGALIPKSPVRWAGTAGGADLATSVLSPERQLPIVVISELQGLVLYPDITARIASDLAGLAIVGQADDEATWDVSARLGVMFSCYRGAIRLYWPRLSLQDDPYRHPLWTAQRLMERVPDSRTAADRIRRILKRQIMSVAVFTVRSPALIVDVQQREREQRFSAQRQQLREAEDYRELAESYAREVAELNQELQARDERIEDLQRQLANVLTAYQSWRPEIETEEISPETALPPSTVAEVVARARQDYADALLFGDDVDTGVRGLAEDAGPPDKVLLYLSTLADLARTRRSGSLGTSVIAWLNQRNISASAESETVTNSATERQRRTWHDGTTRRPFVLHLKPAEATTPDRCVRIYYDWDEQRQQYIVGWVGRHP